MYDLFFYVTFWYNTLFCRINNNNNIPQSKRQEHIYSLPFCLASLAFGFAAAGAAGALVAAGAGFGFSAGVALGLSAGGALGLSAGAALVLSCGVGVVGDSFLAGVLDLDLAAVWPDLVGVGLTTPADGVRAFLMGGGLLLVDLLPVQ